MAAVNPLVGLTATGLLPALDLALGRWQQRQARNIGRALDAALEDSLLTPDELLERLTGDDLRLALLGESLSAAARSAVEAKVVMLGRGLRTGAVAEDDAIVDEERLWTGILAPIEAPHLRMLLHLFRNVEKDEHWQQGDELLEDGSQ